MDSIILWVANAFFAGGSVAEIHDTLHSHGMSEDNIYLMITAGKYLADKRKELIKNYKPQFGRK